MDGRSCLDQRQAHELGEWKDQRERVGVRTAVASMYARQGVGNVAAKASIHAVGREAG